MKDCVWCGRDFEARRGQIYCSENCRIDAVAEATTLRKERARRARRKAAAPRCVVCGSALSMYGTGDTCTVHTHPLILSGILKEIRKRV